MRKLMTLLAASTLMVSAVALAEDQTSSTNPNDVLQQVPTQQAGSAGNMNMADATNSNQQATQGMDQQDPSDKPMKKKHHHKKHHHHNGKMHHHRHKAQTSASAEPQNATQKATTTAAADTTEITIEPQKPSTV